MEGTKALAAVLVAGITFSALGLLADNLSHPQKLEKTAIDIAIPQTAVASGPVGDPPVEALLASADPAKGMADTKAAGCVACHTFTDGGKAGIGPNLYNVVGGPHAHMVGYNYSDALKAVPGPWTYDELYLWLKKPSAYAHGTKMTFAGLANPQKRAEIISYLRSLSPNPLPLPPVPAVVATPAAGAEPTIDELLPTADATRGHMVTMHVGCVACHTFTKGGKAGLGPNLWNVVGGPHAHMVGYNYSAALKAVQGPWTYGELFKWLKKPSLYAPGTKMTFAGLPDPQKRADVIMYLRSLSDNPLPLPGK